MILRVINFIVIIGLVAAAAWVYRIKFDSTVQAEHLAKLRTEVRQEQDKIAALRAQWGRLDDPARIQALTERFLKLKPVDATQFDSLDHLPDQPPDYMRPGSKDPIGGLIEHVEEPVTLTTGSVPVSPPVAAAPAAAAMQPAPAPEAALLPPAPSDTTGTTRP